MHRRVRSVFALGLAVLLGTATLRAQSAPGADSARALLAARGIPGGQVVIYRGDEQRAVVNVAFGFANVDSSRAVTTETRFRVGSISKLFTALAVAQLWEAGRVNLDAPVQTLVPEFNPSAEGVTIRRLAGHIAGVRHYIPRDVMRAPQRFGDVIAPLALFSADTLIAAPETRYHYTSFGYNLLGAVVQRASGEEYRAYLTRTLFTPFGMTHTVAERSDSAITDLSLGYDGGRGTPTRVAQRTDLSDRWPSGGFLSNATDLARFADQVVRGGSVSPSVRTLLFTSMRTADGKETGVGFGWRIGADAEGRVVYHHGGASVGGRAMLVVWRDLPIAVAITTNLSNAAITERDAMALGELVMTPAERARR